MGFLGRIFGSDESAAPAAAGLSAQASIVSLREGGPYVNNRPTIAIDLDVDVAGRDRYRAQAKQTVGRLTIGRLVPGAAIPVRVDPDDPAKVSVDEAAMLGQPDGG